MPSLFESIVELEPHQETIRRRAYGVIEVVRGEFRRIAFRPWPKVISLAEIQWLGRAHARTLAGRCLPPVFQSARNVPQLPGFEVCRVEFRHQLPDVFGRRSVCWTRSPGSKVRMRSSAKSPTTGLPIA